MSSFSSITSSFSSSSALYRRGHELLALLSSLLVPENNTIQLRADLANYITETLFLLQKSLLKKYEDRIDFVLKELKKKVDEVRGMSVYCPPGPTQHPFAVNFYSALEELWLYQCPPSTIIGLYNLRTKLVRLTVEYSGICDMADVLTPVKQSLRSNLQPMILPEQAPTVPRKYQWSNLLVLRLIHCGIVRIDESLHFFPNLVSLDLSHNHIMHIAHLQDCIALESINLSYNRIRVLSNLERVLGKVKRLDVSHNEVQSLDGLDKIYSLELINLTSNLISDILEIQHVARLPCLEALLLGKNPISELPHYRLRVFGIFIQVGSILSGDRPLPILDRQPIAKQEQRALRKLTYRSPLNTQCESTYIDYSVYGAEGGEVLGGDMWDEVEGGEAGGAEGEGRESLYDDGGLGGLAEASYPEAMRRVSGNRAVSRGGERTLSSSRTSRMSLRSALLAGEGKRTSVDSRLSRFSSAYVEGGGGLGRRTDAYGNNFYRDQRLLQARGQRGLSPRSKKKKLSRATIIDEEEDRGGGSGGKGGVAGVGLGLGLDELREVIEEKVRLYGPMFIIDPRGAIRQWQKAQGEVVEGGGMSPVPCSSPYESRTASPVPTPLRTDSPVPSPVPSQASPQRMDTFIGKIHEGAKFTSFSLPLEMDETGVGTPVATPTLLLPPASSTDLPFLSDYRQPSFSDVLKSASEENHTSHTTIPVPAPSGSVYGATPDLPPVPEDDTNNQAQEGSEDFAIGDGLYRGDPQYRSLGVVDNLTLYFREQVFGGRSGGGIGMASGGKAKPSPFIYLCPAPGEGKEGEYFPPFDNEERFLCVYVEKMVELGGMVGGPPLLHTLPSSTQTTSSAAPTRRFFTRTNTSNSQIPMAEDIVEEGVEGAGGEGGEVTFLLVLSDFALYFIDYREVTEGRGGIGGRVETFEDAPLFTVLRAHPLHTITNLTIYFGFQRFSLHFDEHALRPSAEAGGEGAGFLGRQHTYLVVTRDKAKTYPMITKIPQVANAQRQQQSGLLKVGNVKINNLDSSLLEQVLSYVQALGSHHDDIVHYQMLYLVDKNAKGQAVKLPRTVIITQSLILLCHENLMSSAVELKILESYSLKDIQQVFAEENALYVSVVFKRTKILAKKKKWRLCTEGRNPSNKFVEECKRACADVGNEV